MDLEEEKKEESQEETSKNIDVEQEESKNIEQPEKNEEVEEKTETPEVKEEEKAAEEEVKEESTTNNEGSAYKVVNKNKKQVKTAVAIVMIVLTVLIVLAISTVFAIINLSNTNIIDGVKIKGVELVGFSKKDAKLELEEVLKEQLEMQIILKYGDYETSISPAQIEASYNIDEAIEKAYSIGRSGNIISNNYEILFAMLFERDVEIDFSYNDKSLTQMCEDISKKIPGAMKDNSYYIEGEKLIITRGTTGKVIKVDELKELIINQIIEGLNKNAIEIPVEEKVPEAINLEKIHHEVYKEPKDAYYTSEPFTIYPHEEGVDFAISMEEAKKLLVEDKTEYEIPLKYTIPEVTTDEIGTEAFPNLLASFTTQYDVTNRNRTTNLELAASKINGCVLLPGEEFSYNKVVGERTIAAGYKEAAMYSGGEVVDGLGGGICQISSTLYNAVVMANLDITQRSNHQFITSYVGAGEDATVVYGAIDFKFVNSRKYPVKIESTVKNGIAEMKIYGAKEEVEYDIKIETEILSYIPYSTKYIEDPTLEAGVERVKQYGAQGCKSAAYKVCRLNGVVVSKTLLSTDTYSPMTKIVRRGTKGATTVKETTPKNTTTKTNTNTVNKTN